MSAFFPNEIATELLGELITIIRRVYLCRQTSVQLRQSVETILPIITDIHLSAAQLREPRRNQLSDLLQLLRHALDLARELSASSRFNVYRTIQLSRKMEKVEGDISRWIQRLMPVHVMADVVSLRVESNARFDRLEGKLEGVIGEGKIRFLGMVEREGEVLGVRVRVGRERVKDMLLDNVCGGGEIVGICGIGGSGKTTLAREICKDAEIQSMLFYLL